MRQRDPGALTGHVRTDGDIGQMRKAAVEGFAAGLLSIVGSIGPPENKADAGTPSRASAASTEF